MEEKQILYNLREAALAGASKEETAIELGFDCASDFEKFLKKNKKAREIWDQSRFDFWKGVKAGAIRKAKEGNVAAINFLTELLREDRGVMGYAVTLSQLAELTGKTLSTISTTWRNQKGMPYDVKTRTVNLHEFFKWAEKYYIKIGRKKGSKPNPKNVFQDAKTEKLLLDLQKEKGALLDRQEVIAGLALRLQRLKQEYFRLGDIAIKCEGKTSLLIREELSQFFEKLLRTQMENLEGLKLDPVVENKLLELLTEIKNKE